MSNRYLKAFCICLPTLLCAFSAQKAAAETEGILATVNDRPVTSFDVEQRIKLFQVLGETKSRAELRKRAFQSLIDDIIKIEEAKKTKSEPTDEMVSKQIERIAKGLGTTVDGLAAKLKAKGISMTSLRSYVSSEIAFSRMLGTKGAAKPELDKAEVDRRYSEIKAKYNKIINDPRMKPVTVYQIQVIELPVDAAGDPNEQQILQSRAIEARQFMSRYKGCNSARAAAEGIFNVKIGKTVDADGSKFPAQLKAELDKEGPGKAIGPGRTKTGLQVIGYCGKRTITPPKPQMPAREAIENAVLNEAYDKQEETYMVDLRKKAYIEYKGASQPQ
jgi:peptidyl-prolyl cis-trans isomerase SurA